MEDKSGAADHIAPDWYERTTWRQCGEAALANPDSFVVILSPCVSVRLWGNRCFLLE